MPSGADDQSDRVDAATWMVAGTVVLGSLMSNLDTTIVSVALDTLARDFGTAITTVQWVTTGYLLALAIAIPLAPWAAERFGGRQVWMTSVGLFLLGSMLAGASWSMGSLIAFRFLQGLGGGMLTPVGMTLLARAAGPARVGRVMAVLGIPMLLGPVLGPVVGGLLVEHAGWRWIFFVNVPIGALAIPLAARLVPGDPPHPRRRLDLTGFLLLSPGLAVLVYGFAETSSSSRIAGPQTLALIALGLSLVTVFVLHARRADRPLIDVHLFQNRAFSASAATTFFLGMGLFGALFLLPLYYQGARGQTALGAGLLMAPQGIGAAIMMIFSGWATDRMGPGRVVLGGLTLVVLGTVPFAFANASTSYPLLALALVVRGLGLGASTMPAMAGAYARLDGAGLDDAASALNVVRRMGGALGVALLSVVLERHLPGSTGSVSARDAPTSVVADAFGRTFWWTVAFCALALVPALFLPRKPLVARGARRPDERGRRRGATETSPTGRRTRTTVSRS
jgi:EmrB/QacA subfamily drug resistance transporter